MGKGKKKVSFNKESSSTSVSGIKANPDHLIDIGGDEEVEGLNSGKEFIPTAISEKVSEYAPLVSDEMCDKEKSLPKGPKDVGAQLGKAKVNSFADIVKNSRDPYAGFQLTFEESAEEAVRILPEEIVDVGSKFGYALIGYFPTRHPGKIGMDRITRSWDVPVRVIPNVNGWITFIFKTACDRDIVLGGGPYTVFGRTLLLKKMPKWFKFGEDEIDSVPTWVKFPNLPLECWNAKLISRIASKVGRPLMTDKLTTTMERISYARVLIDIDVTKDLVRTIPIIDSAGRPFEQQVEFENEPKFCSICRNIGHYTAQCRKNDCREVEPMAEVNIPDKQVPASTQKLFLPSSCSRQEGLEKMVPAEPAPALPQKQKKSKEPVKFVPALPENQAVLKPSSIPRSEGLSPSDNSASAGGSNHQLNQSSKADRSSSRTSPDSCNQAAKAEGCSSKIMAENDNSSLHSDEMEYVPIPEEDQFQLIGKGNRIFKPKPTAKASIKLKDKLYQKQKMERDSLGKRADSKRQ